MITTQPNGLLFCELASDVKRVEELRGRNAPDARRSERREASREGNRAR